MTFWHYHWALLRARELELTTVETFAFAHMGQLANPAGVCAYSIDSMSADLGMNRSNFSRAVKAIWKRQAIYSTGKDPARRSGGRVATVWNLVPESEARAAVLADRAARRQPLPPATVRDQPLPPATVEPLPPATVRDQPLPPATVQGPAYTPRLRTAAETVATSHGSGAQPLPTDTQPLPTATHYKSRIHDL